MANRMSEQLNAYEADVARYRSLEAESNKQALGRFIVERFNERYFRPILDSPSKHGFAVLAIACLVIETLESFYQGLADTRGKSSRMFQDFFARNTSLKALSEPSDWFFTEIRCGILHQGETRGGWRILRTGPLLDRSGKVINANAILVTLKKAVEQYSIQLETDDVLWKNFKKKMAAVCANCA